MGQLDLPIIIREQESFRSLQNTQLASLKTRGVFSAPNPFAASFDPDHADREIFQERMEQADGIAAPADTSNEQIRETSFPLKNLTTSLETDDALKIAHHHR